MIKVNKYDSFKKKISDILDQSSTQSKLSIIFDYFIVTLILLNVFAIILESFEGLHKTYNAYFINFEIFSVTVFTIEYILRIWTAEFNYHSKNIFISKFKFLSSPIGIIDLLSVIPFYLPMLISIDLRFLRILRLTRLLRVLKLTRYSNALKLIGKIIKDKKDELIATLFLTIILLLVAATLMFYIEHEAQPDAFPNIFASFWWAIATLTTIGYGDIYPITNIGRLLSGIIAILGIGLIALPTGIISSSFMEELSVKSKNNAEDEIPCFCPHCGKRIKD